MRVLAGKRTADLTTEEQLCQNFSEFIATHHVL